MLIIKVLLFKYYVLRISTLLYDCFTYFFAAWQSQYCHIGELVKIQKHFMQKQGQEGRFGGKGLCTSGYCWTIACAVQERTTNRSCCSSSGMELVALVIVSQEKDLTCLIYFVFKQRQWMELTDEKFVGRF